MLPTGGKSGYRSIELAGQLRNWAAGTGSRIPFDSSTGFRLPDGALFSPDASWVRRDRWSTLSPQEQEGFPPLCPDAVFEIRSKSDPIAELRAKMHAYLDNGTRLAVLIDPYDHFVDVYRAGQEPEHLQAVQAVALDPDLPGFVLGHYGDLRGVGEPRRDDFAVTPIIPGGAWHRPA